MLSSITGPLTSPLTWKLRDVSGRQPGGPPSPAPDGYRWTIVTYDGVPETYMGQALYYLERTG